MVMFQLHVPGCRLWLRRPWPGVLPPCNAEQVTVQVLETSCGLSHLKRKGVDMVFVTHPSYQRQGLYSDTSGVYGDNQVGLHIGT